MSDRTRLIVVTNLHNPSGALADEDELRAIGDLASRGGARVLVDEVYLDCAFRRGAAPAHLGPEFVCTNSLTKVYGLSGLRCGWILAEPELAERMWRLNDLFGVNQAHQAERLACIAFDQLDEVIGGNARDARAQSRAVQRLRCLTRTTSTACRPSMGSPRFRAGQAATPSGSMTLLREQYDTAVVPGRWFEMPDHFRVGFGLADGRFRGSARAASARRWTNSNEARSRSSNSSVAWPKRTRRRRPSSNISNPYNLLVAVVLSAQATDASVNIATRPLFAQSQDAASRWWSSARRGSGGDQDDRPVQHQGEERHRASARR